VVSLAGRPAGQSGTATGGAVAVAAGTLSVNHCTLQSNTALGGNGGGQWNAAQTMFSGTAGKQGAGGGAFGGGLYIGSGALHLTFDDIESDDADGGLAARGTGPQTPSASGGGLFKAGGATTLDAFTLAHLLNNFDSNNDGQNNIGS
jgi:hypothetical protein